MRPFRLLLWGFLILLVDFSINGFDVLLDAVGYGFIIAGCATLREHSRHFAQAHGAAIVLLILWVVSLLAVGPVTTASPALVIVFSIVALAIDLFMAFSICRGIAELAVSLPDLARRAMNRFYAYAGTMIAIGLLVFVTLIARSDDLAGLTVVFGLPATIVIAVLMAMLMNEADRALWS